jgi:hypothetical protein
VLAGGTRNTRLSVGQMDHSATNWRSFGRDIHDEMLDAVNDPKLSDCGGWRDGCAGEGGGAASLTAGAVRCIA